MGEYADKSKENKNIAVSAYVAQRHQSGPEFQLTDDRPDAIAPKQIQAATQNSFAARQLKAFQLIAGNNTNTAVQRKEGPEEELPVQGKFSIQAKEAEGQLPVQAQFKSTDQAPIQQTTLQRFVLPPANQLADAAPAIQRFVFPNQHVEKKANNTGLPDNLKAGVENLSGHSLDDVKVHYNSAKPSQLQAHAYAQGTDIHIAPGQERHLPHEAWHVVQQKQGRVQATKQMKGGVAVNDDKGLEREADVMGNQALQLKGIEMKDVQSPGREKSSNGQIHKAPALMGGTTSAIQLVSYNSLKDLFAAIPGLGVASAKSTLVKENMTEAEQQLPFADFLPTAGAQPNVDPNIVRPDGKYTIVFDSTNPMKWDKDFLMGSIIHELLHIANARNYAKNNAGVSSTGGFFNVHVPAHNKKKNSYKGKVEDGLFANFSESQRNNLLKQKETLNKNWDKLDLLLQSEKNELPKRDLKHLEARIGYGRLDSLVENDTVVFDIVFYMEAKKLTHLDTYDFAKKMLEEAHKRRHNIGEMANELAPDLKKSAWYKNLLIFANNWPPTIM